MKKNFDESRCDFGFGGNSVFYGRGNGNSDKCD